ncbi:MAG: heavy metal translocating P-type ATPase [Cyanobacteriota bacterium ELA615]
MSEQVEHLAKTILEVGGMKCAGCVAAVERQLEQHSGVAKANVNLVTEIAIIEYSPSLVQPEDLAQKLTANGFPTQLRSLNQPQINSNQQEDSSNLVLALLLVILSGVGHLEHLGGPHIPYLGSIQLHWALATIALSYTSRSIILEGIKGLLHSSPNMNSLVALGALSSYFASLIAWLFPKLGWECFFEEPVMLLGFILLGRTIEKSARNRAKSSLTNLISLQPKLASLVLDGSSLEAESIEVPIEQIKLGDLVKILPGQKIPVDGRILVGSTTLDESMLTGESIPVAKSFGDIVVGGSLNQSGTIIVQVERIGSQTTLAQIVEAVETAQARKAPVQQLADKVAGYFTYGVMSAAALTFAYWLWRGSLVISLPLGAHHHQNISSSSSPLLLSLKLAISVLVIACPCALGLATPTAILVGTGIAAQKGILIKGGDILEKLRQLNVLIFDKTGTLTLGRPTITDYLPIEGISSEKLLQIASSAQINHPYGIAMQEAAKERNISLIKVDQISNQPGRGIIAQIDTQQVLVGNKQLLQDHGIDLTEDLREKSISLAEQGKTLVYVSQGENIIGILALVDILRPEAEETVQKLKSRGIQVVLATGDQIAVAQKIADKLGIEQVYASITPQGKAQIVAKLQEQKNTVGMIGDGINDAPALAQADLGISLAGASDITQQVADVILMRHNLSDVLVALELSQATFSKIQQNLAFAFGYNLLFIPLAAGVALPYFHLGPALAGAFMASSSILVVLNSLLLNRFKA